MQTTVATKVVTTRTHTSVLSPDEVRGAATVFACKATGLADDAITSVAADTGPDGSVTVTIVERPMDAVEAPPAAAAPASEPAAPASPAPAAAHGGLNF